MSEPSERYDLVIIGGGPAATTAAELAASLDLRVALVEHTRRGAAAQWSSVVATKALTESARVAHLIRHADDVGLHLPDAAPDTDGVWSRIVRISAEAHDFDHGDARLATHGIDVLDATALVTGPHEVTIAPSPPASATLASSSPVTSRIVSTRFVLVCTGSRPRWPDIAGLDAQSAETMLTFWSLTHMPRSVVFIGGGPVSLEISQALSRLGVGCTVLERDRRLLPAEEPALVDRLLSQLRADGVEIVTGVHVTRARRTGNRTEITGSIDGVPRRWGGEAAFVAAGDAPDVDGLGLTDVGVVCGPHGIVVDERGRSSVRSVYAIGEAAAPVDDRMLDDGRMIRDATMISAGRRGQSASHLAIRAVRDMFFPGRSPTESFISSVLFTDPELASTGLTTTEAEMVHGDGVDVWRSDLDHSLGNRVASGPGGEVVIVAARGRIVGAHVLARGAGELIGELALAVGQELKLSDLAHVVHPYPSVSSVVGEVAADSSFELAKKLNWLVRKAR